MTNPEGPEAEDFLWSLGCGASLPDWLKELRQKEKAMGKNQAPRRSGLESNPRPGIGPARTWSGTKVPDISQAGQARTGTAAASGAEPRPTRSAATVPSPSQLPQRLPAPTPSPATSSSPPSVPARRPEQRSEERSYGGGSEELRVDPDDGKSYTLAGLTAKYKDHFPDAEIKTYWREDCRPVASSSPSAASTAAAGAKPPAVAPAAPAAAASSGAAVQPQQVAATGKTFGMSIKDWLMSLDDSGFLVQYHDPIVAKFDSLEQIVDVYVKKGVFNQQFFEEAGIKKLGHKRLFEKWFKDNCR
eukprot:gnl/TRDRNA2_/TRDRNA2_199309_c0_seq1.p1 gnl/TRDRNA2_/TRDRNA2_199309_c0~~gnl/TRDRNA2_/TRDRNA2_199309_c0_seq1.p1  ORF type:complete len:325 (+),score=62.24 gnl/TRDRNA2_/TRDRNA2_199309_c0_seq1:72-977(+)